VTARIESFYDFRSPDSDLAFTRLIAMDIVREEPARLEKAA
jgi:hypothetical protein